MKKGRSPEIQPIANPLNSPEEIQKTSHKSVEMEVVVSCPSLQTGYTFGRKA